MAAKSSGAFLEEVCDVGAEAAEKECEFSMPRPSSPGTVEGQRNATLIEAVPLPVSHTFWTSESHHDFCHASPDGDVHPRTVKPR